MPRWLGRTPRRGLRLPLPLPSELPLLFLLLLLLPPPLPVPRGVLPLEGAVPLSYPQPRASRPRQKLPRQNRLPPARRTVGEEQPPPATPPSQRPTRGRPHPGGVRRHRGGRRGMYYCIQWTLWKPGGNGGGYSIALPVAQHQQYFGAKDRRTNSGCGERREEEGARRVSTPASSTTPHPLQTTKMGPANHNHTCRTRGTRIPLPASSLVVALPPSPPSSPPCAPPPKKAPLAPGAAALVPDTSGAAPAAPGLPPTPPLAPSA